jgi:hypothetical protein
MVTISIQCVMSKAVLIRISLTVRHVQEYPGQWPNPKKSMVYMGPYARVDYNLTLCSLQSRLQHVYHGQPYARVDLSPMPESTLSPIQVGFGLGISLTVHHVQGCPGQNIGLVICFSSRLFSQFMCVCVCAIGNKT